MILGLLFHRESRALIGPSCLTSHQNPRASSQRASLAVAPESRKSTVKCAGAGVALLGAYRSLRRSLKG